MMMDKFCLGFITAITALISLDSLRRLYVERHRFSKEDLNDYDLSFVWRIVIFLIYPLLNLLALWVSIVVCQWCGGYPRGINYGLLWYQVIPDELASRAFLMPALFAGEIIQTVLVLSFLPALFFRPHPFLAMLLTYSCVFVLAINLIADPLLSILGLGSAHWQMAVRYGSNRELIILALSHMALAGIFLALLNSKRVQMLFAKLLRPVAVDKLQKALSLYENQNSAFNSCDLVMLYEEAGLPKQADKQLKVLKKTYPQSLVTGFAEAYLSYRRRNYREALKLFLSLAESQSPLVSNNELKSMFFAAAACCAHANRDFPTANNLVERALEFDRHCAMARMVKIDVLLRQGNPDKAAEEFQTALLLGLIQNIEQVVPIDWQSALKLINQSEVCNKPEPEILNPPNPSNSGSAQL